MFSHRSLACRSLLGCAVVAVALVLCGPLAGCAVGRRHTSDAQLEKRFLQHEVEFEALLDTARSDSKLVTISRSLVIYDGQRVNIDAAALSGGEPIGLAGFSWKWYLTKLQSLGLEGGVLKGRDSVEFRVDAGSLQNGDSYKGYEFSNAVPAHLRKSLDECRLSDLDRDQFGNGIARKHIKGNWYLYLFVNR